jgi:hypothetical protein
VQLLVTCHAPRAQVKAALKRLMGGVHVSVTAACAEYHERFRRAVYVTPKSYMCFLEGYRGLYTRKLGETRALAGAINAGLQKMAEAKVDVNRMKVRAWGSCTCRILRVSNIRFLAPGCLPFQSILSRHPCSVWPISGEVGRRCCKAAAVW